MKRERCRHCAGTGRRLERGPEITRPNGDTVQTLPYWSDCTGCGGSGRANLTAD